MILTIKFTPSVYLPPEPIYDPGSRFAEPPPGGGTMGGGGGGRPNRDHIYPRTNVHTRTRTSPAAIPT